MIDPKRFAEASTLYLKDSQEHLREVKDLLRWQDNENILDVGCGEGQVTSTALLTFLPKNARQLIGIDVSYAVIDVARNHYNHPKITYVVLNITRTIPEKFENHFNHIFSFYCLMMVEDQRTAFQNLFDMLKHGGQMMLSLVLKSSVLDCISDISKNQKWDAYMNKTNISQYPYQFVDKPGQMLLNFLRIQGFTIEFFKVYTKKHCFLTPLFKELVLSVFPLMDTIPEDDRKDFDNDYENAIKSNEIEIVGDSTSFKVVVATVLVSK